MKKPKNGTIATIIALLTIIGICFSVYFYFERRYALAEDLKKVESRLDYKILSDRLQSIQDRIWKIIDRCSGKPTDVTINEELRELENKKEATKKELDKMEGHVDPKEPK